MVEAFLCFSKYGHVSRARVISDGGGMQGGLLPAYRRCFRKKLLQLRSIVLYLGCYGRNYNSRCNIWTKAKFARAAEIYTIYLIEKNKVSVHLSPKTI